MISLHFSPKIVPVFLLAGISALLSFCSGPVEKPAPVEKRAAAAAENKEECIVWSHNDSAAMEVVHLANAYLFDGHRDKARILFAHATTLPHDLPGIAMSAGTLTKDSLEATAFFHKEILHDRRVIESSLPDCRKYEFLVTMYRCYRLLGQPEKADSILKHYRKINNQATPSGETMRGAWAIY